MKDIHSFCGNHSLILNDLLDFCFDQFSSVINESKKNIIKGEQKILFIKSNISSVIVEVIYETLFSLYKQEVNNQNFQSNSLKYQNEDILFSQRIMLLFDSKKESYDHKLSKLSNFELVIEEFSKITNEKSILGKQKCLKNGYHEILKINTHGADLSLPSFVFALVQAKIPNLYTEFKILFDFTQHARKISFFNFNI